MIHPAGRLYGRLRAPVFLLLLPITLGGAPAGAHPGDGDLRRGLDNCARIATESARLACFDALVSREPEAADAREEAFGGEILPSHRDPGAAEELDAITAEIRRLEQRPYGERVFHLSNGQVWTELEPGRARYREGLEVSIERTPFGGYMLSTGAGRATRVKRLL